ncbi:MAG: histidine phosphatase family protein [Candidatus Staskawiczbacteria bacterium]|nr:histidine phosphatase family protein [Candidatus Staskawiczbacteria bacterium]
MFSKLKNKYFALRHGESKANTAEIIVSNLEDAINEEYSLTKNGEKQVSTSIENSKKSKILDSEVIIYCSPFSRCKRTAEITKELLGIKIEINIDERLRERWFGSLDKSGTNNYQKVWSNDSNNRQPEYNEESVENVKNRVVSLIDDLEKIYQQKKILLVSHGDVLQILETQFKNKSSNMHRSIKSLERGELRELIN